MARTKLDQIHAVADACVLSRNRSAQVVNTLIELIKNTLERGEEVSIRRFGKFRVCDRNGLKPRSSAQPFDMPADARRIVVFRSSPVLDEKINDGAPKNGRPSHRNENHRAPTLKSAHGIPSGNPISSGG